MPVIQRDHVNPYLIYYRPCSFASIEVNERCKFRRRYRADKAAVVMPRGRRRSGWSGWVWKDSSGSLNLQLDRTRRFIEAIQPPPALRSEPLVTRGGGPAAG